VTSTAALSAAALLAGLSASPLGGAPTAGGEVTFEAQQVVFHGETGTYDLSGGVVVRRGLVVLRARTATVNPDTGDVVASGDVLLVEPTRAVHADGMHAILEGPFEATGVTAYLKNRPMDPTRITTPAEARRGTNRLTLRAEQVEGEDERHMTLRGVHFTLCDCGENKAPSWELTARKAKVKEDRAYLDWPVFHITPRFLLVRHPVPVLVLPWISLPLTNRQTGVLFPEVGTRSVTGWSVGLPVYVTLGRSADLTATPEYFFGPSSPHQLGGAVKGPGARLELRWAPAQRAEGEVLFHLVDDLDRERPGGAGAAGLRLSIQGSHAQSFGADTRLSSHLLLSQDPYMIRDFSAPGLPADAYYSRSDVLVSHRGGDWVVEGDARYLEPLGAAFGGNLMRPREFGWFGVQAPTLQRWPSASAALLPVRLGPLQLEGRAGLARYAPLVGHRGELLPTDPATFGTWEGVTYREQKAGNPQAVVAVPREAVTRPDARLQLSTPLLVGGLVSVEPYVRGAALGYAFDAGRGPAATAWGLAGLSGSLELARWFGRVKHRIVPRLELLAGTSTWRANPGDPFAAYDPWDRIEPARRVPVTGAPGPLPVAQKLSAAPDGAYQQLRVTLENRLESGAGAYVASQLGQDVDLRIGRLAETAIGMQVVKGPFTGGATARFLAFGGRPPLAAGWKRSWLDEFTRFQAGASIHDGRGDSLRASLDAAGTGAVGAEGAGVDALFDLRPSGAQPDANYNLGARVGWGGASLDYALQLAAREKPKGMIQCANGEQRRLEEFGVSQQTAMLTWDSPCHCFLARVTASFNACGDPSLGFQVDLSKILQGAAR
jgi:LPS-assembly protein